MASHENSIAAYPLKTYEKLRYADTDRQGHINNAIFSTMLETGRVELLYAPDSPLYAEGCAFVIASLHLDFHGEINWPGNVDIGTRVANIGNSSIAIEQGLFQNDKCVATAKTTIVQMNESTRRSHPLSGAAKQRLSEFMSRP